ncbi:MAG: type II toxin-antitoxin system PemK/MazF family toxin [Caldilineaceae bacterium]|nr:type II toxin-antitoxin system PemK/MazF family toxin [Caldilineaceae bacterium]
MNIRQGDLYWLYAAGEGREAALYPHPYVVLQADVLNDSRLKTVVVCALTSNLKRMAEPGNVLLETGEANLPRQSVVIVSQVESVEKTQLGDYIGSLSQPRVEEIFAGMRFQQRVFFARDA